MNAALFAVPTVNRAASSALEEQGEADAIIVARCRAGEREAFGILLHRYRDRIINLAYQLLGQREDAEDVAQEAFAQAFRHIGSFRGESQFYTWLYRITVNLCLARKRRLKKSNHLDEERDNGASEYSSAGEIEMRLAVEQALRQIYPPLRTGLVLREMQGLSYDEIAAILHIPLGTVRSRLWEARRRFREVWDKEEL